MSCFVQVVKEPEHPEYSMKKIVPINTSCIPSKIKQNNILIKIFKVF